MGSDWAEQEQVRAAVAMYVGQVGEIINHEIPLDEQVANYELFGESNRGSRRGRPRLGLRCPYRGRCG